MLAKKAFQFGKRAEDIAATFLKKKGYAILERNYRVPVGEVDLICKKAGWIVFVEVKARTSKNFGGPEAAMTPWKRARIIKAAKWYIMEKVRSDEVSFRFDCVFVTDNGGLLQVEHLEGAFQE